MLLAEHEEGVEMGEADPTLRGPVSASAPAPPAESRSDVELTGHAHRPGGPRSKGRSPRIVLVLGVAGVLAVILVLVIAGKGAGGGGAPTPDSTIREFFAAWSRGDAATVARDSTLIPIGEPTAHPVWDQRAMASMLSLPENRSLFSDVQVTVTTEGEGTTASVRMRYSGTPYVMSLELTQVDGHWRFAMYPSILRIDFPGDGTVFIDGVPVRTTAGHALELDVYPGAHRIHMDGSAIVAPYDSVIAPVEPDNAAYASPTQTLTPAAVTAAHQAIHAWLTQCATSTQLQPGNGCPQVLVGGGTISNVHWTLTNDGSDATVGVASPTTASAQGSWAMSATWDDTDMGYTEHNHQDDSDSFTATLTWNGSGFDVQPQQ